MLTFIYWSCGRINENIQNSPEIALRYCLKCERREAVRDYESIIESKLLSWSDFRASNYVVKNFFPVEKPKYHTSSITFREVFERKSCLSNFNEYILYWYEIDKGEYYKGPNDTIYNGYFIIEFNCGTEPFGYDTTKANIEYFWEGKYPGLTPVRDVPLDSFKLGYYSIIKWLYAQETDRYKVKRKKYEHFDYDYMSNPSVALENLVLEDPWQEEFLFTTYELIDTRSKDDYDYPKFTVVPYTLAPIHLYEVRTSEYQSKRGKYHINVSDMAIRVYKYPPYEER